MIRLLTNDTAITNFATTTGVVAALLMALNLNQFILAYALFIISSVLWAIFAFRTNKQLLTINIVFIIINVIGLVRFS
jgi:hypothetical protein